MTHRLLAIAAAVICTASVSANDIAVIFGKAEYEGEVSDQIVFSEMDCGNSYDIEGVCSIGMTNLNSKYSTSVSNHHLHWYKSDRMTITPEEGVTISAITMVCTEAAYCDKLTPSTGSANFDKTSATISWAGQASAPFTLTASSSQVRISYAVVDYADTDHSGVKVIADDDTDNFEAEYYTPAGIRVLKPSHGLYICKKGPNVSKIYIQ